MKFKSKAFSVGVIVERLNSLPPNAKWLLICNAEKWGSFSSEMVYITDLTDEYLLMSDNFEKLSGQ